MKISEFLNIKPGMTAIIGGGGKTSLMYALAEELMSSGRVIVCTSTKIMRPEGIPVFSGQDEAALEKEFDRTHVVCVGEEYGGGKLTAPAFPFGRLLSIARYVLVEADGSNRLPMKAHAPGEPVIPEAAGLSILVMGAGGFGRTIRSAAHRPALFAQLAGASEDDVITPELAARVAQAEGFHDCVFVNQVESDATLAAARLLQTLVDCPVIAGSLRLKEYIHI